jgi:hypothetical protein
VTSLYNLSAEYASLAALLADADEVTPEIDAVLDSLGGELADKIDGVCKLRQRLRGDAAMAREEAKRLAFLAQTRENHVSRLDEYVKTCLTLAGLVRYDTPLFKVWIQNNSAPSVTWTGDPAEPPEAFTKVTVTFDAKGAGEAWRRGEALPEGVVVERGTHLRVK